MTAIGFFMLISHALLKISPYYYLIIIRCLLCLSYPIVFVILYYYYIAAEASCRLRFGPHVNWIGQFDIDEYLIPMGNHTTILPVLDQLDKEDKKIVSLGSWRAWPRLQYIEQPTNTEQNRFDLKIPQNTTILQAYNCDRQPPGQKNSQMPAEKQLYRPEYVLQHFVHYSAATVLSEMNKTEYKKQGFGWKGRAFPDARQRFINELTEGLMIHTKAVASQ